MNKNLKKLSLIALLVAVAGTFACKKTDDPAPSGDSGVHVLQGELTGTTNLTADTKYLLKGFVYVPSGSTINIQAGTVVTGQVQAALIIEPGATINAIGTASNPIIFTSAADAGTRARGNWGGLVLAGNAKVNTATPSSKPLCEGGIRTHYGNDVSADASVDQDNSGTLKYVRIEYAGYAPIPGSELNGLTFSGVGNGTTIEYVQTSYANDDGMEFFGGCVNAKHVINFAAIDDDFDTDCGYSGRIQFGLAVKAQYDADQSGSKAFESDHDANAGTNLPGTTCQFSNMTLVGPVTTMTDVAGLPFSENLGNGGKPAKNAATFIGGVHVRRNSSLSLYNSLVLAWNAGILIDGKPGGSGVTTANITAGTLEMKNNLVAGISKDFSGTITGSTDTRNYDVVGINNGAGDLTAVNPTDSTALSWGAFAGPHSWFYATANNNKYQVNFDGVLNMNYQQAWHDMIFDFTPAGSSPALSGADFTGLNSFFTTTSYKGAFAAGDTWHSGWSNFNPQVVAY
ncbi:MAG: hypothetical protein JWM14_1100 [Chitinophagaceae bacterium]|nr:hypothetical protein [Chitinophagaceae bacterium]